MTSRFQTLLFTVALGALAGTAHAQIPFPKLPVLIPLGRDQPPPPPPPGMPGAPLPPNLQADLAAKAGSDTVYFSRRGYTLDRNAMTTLAAQAQWLIANPFVSVRLEGHGDQTDTRDYAIAIGERRSNAVRDFLVLHGVAPQRITVTSWGKERPGSMRVGPTLVTVGPRVTTVIQ